jgi:hypothetical protein
MAAPDGFPTAPLVALYRDLAAGVRSSDDIRFYVH